MHYNLKMKYRNSFQANDTYITYYIILKTNTIRKKGNIYVRICGRREGLIIQNNIFKTITIEARK